MEPRFIVGPPGTGKTYKWIVKKYKELLAVARQEYEDIVNGHEGQYRVRLLDNKSALGIPDIPD